MVSNASGSFWKLLRAGVTPMPSYGHLVSFYGSQFTSETYLEFIIYYYLNLHRIKSNDFDLFKEIRVESVAVSFAIVSCESHWQFFYDCGESYQCRAVKFSYFIAEINLHMFEFLQNF